MAGLNGLQFDGNFFTVGDVDSQINVAKRSGTDLSDQSVFAADNKVGATTVDGRARHSQASEFECFVILK